MPELPEVESVCRLMRRVLVGQPIRAVEIVEDNIVFAGAPREAFVASLDGATVQAVGRRGKFWWLELDRKPMVFGHLGMNGWIRELGKDSMRLHSHGEAPLDDEAGRPRFMKWRLETDLGAVAMTDSRRFARVWLGDSPETDKQVLRLGPDAFTDLPSVAVFSELVRKRKTPIKALLLNQSFLAGIGNWIADETLFHAGIRPSRLASDLSAEESARLHDSIRMVLALAVSVDANYQKFPDNWLFHFRWGGGKGKDLIEGDEILRETVGGRTTAWVPSRQR